MKPIKLSENIKQKLIEEFTKSIDNAKLSNDTLHFTAKITDTIAGNISKPTVYFSATAYLKMLLYVRDTPTEIAWHGIVEKNEKENWYFISDVFLYPQKLAAATVQTDQEKYNEWIINLDDDTHNTMRFQGHSHVNFAATPSGTDLSFYNDILQVLPNDDYYIFMILNKTGDMTLLIYDLATNIIYDTEDINIKIITTNERLGAEDYDTIGSIADEKQEYCETPKYSYSHYDSYKPTNANLINYSSTYNKNKNLLNEYDKDDNYLIDQDTQTDTDDLFDEIDKKWKNSTLKSTKKRRKK